MKKLITLIPLLFILLNLAAQKAPVKTQPVVKEIKHDVILKTVGDVLEGTVKEILDSEIKFSHKGEALIC